MNKFLETISNTTSKVGFELKKHSPEILVTVGVVGVVASAVMACRATLKLKPVLEEHKDTVTKIHESYEESEGVYPEEAKNRDIATTYAKTGWNLVKLYGPAVLVGTVSIASILGSHKILTDRNMATAAAYTALSETLRGYRDRVAQSVGEETEKKLWFEDVGKDVVPSNEVDVSADGGKKKKTSTDKFANHLSPYARIFDAGNEGWDDNPELTLYFLRAAETNCNNLLQSRGHLFLNEVYDMLGYARTRMGQYVGWLYKPDDKNYHSYVDFGIYDIRSKEKSMFLNGDEQNIILDFNVDGVILNDISKED